MRKQVIIILIFLALCVALVISVRTCRSLQIDRARLLQNQSILLHNGQVELGKTADGRSMTSVPALTVHSGEFLSSSDTLPRLARAMGVKPSRIREAATVSSVTKTSLSIPIAPDSIAGHTSPSSTRSLSYSDPWFSLSASIHADSLSVALQSHDTLDIIVHRVPKRFLFFRFGCKAVRMNISSRNPYTNLVYSRFYQITD